MMSPDDRTLEDILYCSDLGDEAGELGAAAAAAGVEESSAVDNVSIRQHRY